MDRNSPDLSLVVPVFNEADSLKKVIEHFLVEARAISPSFEILLSENGSKDGSVEIADQLAMQNPEVRTIHSDVPDYGFALKRGFLAAKGRIVVNFSVDFYDFNYLKLALPLMEKHDLILGSKNVTEGSDQRPFIRRFGGMAFHAIVRNAFGLPVHDTHGFKVFYRERVQKLIQSCQNGAALFDTELVLRAHKNGFTFCELPVSVAEVRPSRRSVAALAIRSITGLVRLKLTLFGEHFSRRESVKP